MYEQEANHRRSGLARAVTAIDAADVAYVREAHIKQGFASERGPAARPAIQYYRTIFAKGWIMGRRVGVGFEFEQAARDGQGTFDLTTGGDLGSISDIDNQRVGFRDQIGGACWRDRGDSGAGGGKHVFDGCGHVGVSPLSAQVGRWP
jgi:hypothetical protein